MTRTTEQSGKWEYAPAPESAPIEIADRYGLFIGGEFCDPSSGQWRSSISPANEQVLSDVAEAGADDVNKAIAAARDALPGWAGLSGRERGKYLFRIARRIQERARELAILETMDGGKPIKESRDVDIPLVAHHFFYYAGWADKLEYAFCGRTASPVGVCAQIIPWNFPLLMAAWKIAPALACGNTVVLKPAETTPLTALRLADILQEVGLPPGVVNIVPGGPEAGAALAGSDAIDKLAFTGSTEVGKRLAQIAAKRGIPLTLELGGKSPNILFDDAPIDQAVEGIISGIYFNQGHVCCAGSRVLVQEGIAEEVVSKLEWRMKSLRVGDPLDKNTDIGAINSAEQLARIKHFLEVGPQEGAVLHQVAGDSELPDRGFWCRPCFFTGVQPSHVIAREEIFGPVLAVMTFRTPKEAVERANNTKYGLAAGIWTDKGAKIFNIATKLKAGVVWCNTYNKFDPGSPFGGFKESGFGREGGMQGLRAYVRL
ncbi:MAG: aldehyde dehydrogenase family protein [Planctomycetes bacterium]|nr:aldehyde dehydrogenase family protein [Planctomycetota bacterium]NOG54358.1 aldehyde dehydrogenase family protein [Planctomycetota bacterium]